MKLTKDEKIKLKQERSYKRRNKRFLKDQTYYNRANSEGYSSISIGRRIITGQYYRCEMGYLSCESRGYCNGDC